MKRRVGCRKQTNKGNPDHFQKRLLELSGNKRAESAEKLAALRSGIKRTDPQQVDQGIRHLHEEDKVESSRMG